MIDNIYFYIVKSLPTPTTTPNQKIILLDGNKTETILDFYNQIRGELSFGAYFGNNLDALYDTMTDLSWLSETHIEFHFANTKHLFTKETNKTKNSIINTFNDIAYENDLAPDFDGKKAKKIRYLFEYSPEVEELLEANYIIWEAKTI